MQILTSINITFQFYVVINSQATSIPLLILINLNIFATVFATSVADGNRYEFLFILTNCSFCWHSEVLSLTARVKAVSERRWIP
jgi:hypothetical protein